MIHPVIKTVGIRSLRVLVALLLLLLLALAAIVFSLTMERGRLFWLNQGLNVAQTSGFAVIVDDVQWPSLGTLRLGHVLVTQGRNPLIEAVDIRLQIELPLSLWQSSSYQPHIRHLIIDKLAIHQPPPSPPTPNKPKRALRLPERLPSFKLEQANINELRLFGFNWPKQVKPSVLSIQMQAESEWDSPLALNLKVDEHLPTFKASEKTPEDSHSEPLFSFKVSSSFNQSQTLNNQSQVLNNQSKTLNIESHVRQDQGRWLSQWLNWPSDQPLDIELTSQLIQTSSYDIELKLDTLATQLFNEPITLSGDFAFNLKTLHLQIAPLVIRHGEQQHEIVGNVDPKKMALVAAINQFDLAVLSPWVPGLKSGQLSAESELNWIFAEQPLPSGYVNIDARATYNQAPVNLNAQLDLAGESIVIKRLKGNAESLTLAVKGRANIRRKSHSLTVTMTHLRDATLRKLLPESIIQQLPPALRVHMQKVGVLVLGTWDNPRVIADFDAFGLLEKTPWLFYGDASYVNQTINVSEFVGEFDDVELKAEGALDLVGEGSQFSASVRRLSPDLAYKHQVPLPPGFVGRASANVDVSGALKQPRVKAKVSFQGGYENRTEVLPFKFSLAAQSQVGGIEDLSVNIEKCELATFSKPLVAIKGRVNQQENDLKISVTRLPVALLEAFGLNTREGKSHARLRLQGSFQEPKLAGYVSYGEKITIRDEKDKAKQVPLIWHANIASDDKDLTISSGFTLDRASAGLIDITLPWHDYLTFATTARGGDLPLKGRIESEVDLSALQLFVDTDQISMRGQLESDLIIDGTPKQPLLNGGIQYSKGYLKLAASGTEFVDIHVKAIAEGQRFTLEDTIAHDRRKGSVEITGDLDWRDLKSSNLLNVALIADDAYLFDVPNANGAVSGKVSIKGGLQALAVDGDLDVRPLNINIDSTPAPSIPTITVEEINEKDSEEERAKSLVPEIALRIDVGVKKQAFVRGRGLTAELSGNVAIRGTAAKPEMVGEFKTLNGELKVLQKPLGLSEGRVNFSNQAYSYYVPAKYITDDYDITVAVSGTNESLNLELSSVPDLPQEEILSYLLFGDSVQNITPLEALSLASAVNTLSNGSSFDPLNATRDRLGFDNLRVGQDSEADGGGVNVGVGKYLNERVYLELERSSNPAQPWQGNLKVDLTDEIKLDSSTTGTGRNSASIKWQRDY